MKHCIRTDLACEREGGARRGEFRLHGCRVCEVTERLAGESVRYASVYLSPAGAEQAPMRAVAQVLANTAARLVSQPRCVLVACLGNPRITPDSLGPCTARTLQVTRHVQLLDAAAFARFEKGALCAVAPGVLGDTGIESAEFVRGVAKEVGAELVVAVDALAASNRDHIGTLVQISDHGLRPGAGVGNRRVAIDAGSIGCPVISLGMPTVIDCGTLLGDALLRAGICGVGEELEQYLASVGRYLVAPVDIDRVVMQGGALLADAIGACFGPGM